MKRSRIICSIITVIYILLSVALTLLLIKSSVTLESSVNMYLKAIHVAAFGLCTLVYIGVKRKLANKMSNKTLSIKISQVYCYLYLAIVVLVSRVVMAYILKDNVVGELVPGFSLGLGSYINHGLGILVRNKMYANIILNTVLVFISSVLIKKIMLNITDNDTISTITSVLYILLPLSLVNVLEYVRYNYNIVAVLSAIWLFTKIIDEVKKFNKKSNRYLIYSVVLGLIQALDIILGGSYVLWVCALAVTALAAMYIDSVHIRMRFNSSVNYKFKRFAEKIERINISKLVHVCGISLMISGITALICALTSNINRYKIFNVTNSVNVLMHARTYYLVLIICSLVFEIIGIILKRKLDVKMFIIKVAFVVVGITTFFMVDGIYASALFDTLLVITVITNICNICYNREERVKLLKDKN